MGFVGTENKVVDEAFNAAFDDALNGIITGDTPADTTPADTTPADTTPADTTPADTTPADTTPADTTPADTTPADTTPAPSALEVELAQARSELAALKAAQVATPTPAPIAPTPEAPSAEELQAKAAEDKAWADFEEDFPEVAAMMKRKQAGVEAQLAKALDTVKQLTEQVTPITTSLAASEDEKFIQTILTTHKDAGTLLPEVEKWILTLPRHRQVGANFVLDRGSAQDVVALYTEFKVETGKLTPPDSSTPAPTPTPAPQPDATKADKLRKMEAVSSRRTEHQEPPDSSDFDGAFAEALGSDKI